MDYIDFAHCNYIKMEPNDQIMEQRSYGDRPITARLIVAYFCLAILLCLIIVYAVLSQSLFSTIAVAFLVVLVVISIATPYRLNPL
jgi:heme/copper-type cytochrome/quinol oxidase subunit 4